MDAKNETTTAKRQDSTRTKTARLRTLTYRDARIAKYGFDLRKSGGTR